MKRLCLKRLWLAPAAALLTACGSVPPTPAASIAPPLRLDTAAGTLDTQVPADWWRLFDDAALDPLVQRTLAANLDLRSALATLETARAAQRLAGAARLPQTAIESGAGPTRADRQPSTATVPKSGYELGATVSYEIDLFGRLRAAAAAAQADTLAAQATLDAARVSAVADTVGAYLDLCAASRQIVIAQQQLDLQQQLAELLDSQLRAGEISPLEQARASVERYAATAALPPLQAERQSARVRLSALQGLTPAAAPDPDCQRIPAIRQPLPIGDGAGLIARRPDIREAEHRLAAASARIGVATAELYPRINLGASAGLIAGGADAVLTPLLSWTFPVQNPARARIAAARGVQAGALAQWDASLLRALGEVETALAQFQAAERRRQALQQALHEAEAVLARATTRLRHGADDRLAVLAAARARNDTARLLTDAELQLARSQLALFRALGGGWQTPAGDVAD